MQAVIKSSRLLGGNKRAIDLLHVWPIPRAAELPCCDYQHRPGQGGSYYYRSMPSKQQELLVLPSASPDGSPRSKIDFSHNPLPV